MKTIKLLLSCMFSIGVLYNSYGVNYVSASGGAWETNTTWSPVGIPGQNDNVTISAGHVVTIGTTGDKCNNLTVSGQLKWLSNISITVFGNYNITATGSESGTGLMQFNPPGTQITCTGTTSQLVYYSFYTGRTITAGSVVNKSYTTTKIMNNCYVNNLGTYFTGTMDARTGSVFYNGVNGVLNIKNTGFMAGRTFNAHAAGNTVNILYITGALPTTAAGFYNLTLAATSGAKTLPAATVVANNLTINASNTLNSNGFDLSVGGNWTNNGAFTQGVRTVTLNGNGTQSIGGTANTTFYRLAKTGTSVATLTRNLAITNLLTISAGVLNASTFTLSGAAGLTQSGGELRLGKISATVPELSGAYSLTGGKITFNGAGAQTIRSGITYFDIDALGTGTKSLAAALNMNGSLTIGSTLDVTASNFAINIGGNWTNNGTFNQRLGTVTFNGTAGTQILSGSASTTFENLTLTNTSGATITGGTYLLDGALTISDGPFNTGGNSFTMTSTAAKTARIAPLTGSGSIAGNFIVQRFITTRDTTWADLSSAVQASTFNDWDNELPAISYLYSPPNQYPTQYTYSEPADDFVPVTSSATALTPGKGYEVFLAGSYSHTNFPDMAINTIGVPNQGNQDLSGLISFTGAGSNLVGNPFASSISWTTVFTASSRLLNTYDVYDYTSGNYNTFGLGTEIGSGQGFWVYATGASPQLVVNENAKTTSSNSSLRSTVAEPYFTLKLSSNDVSNTYYHVLKIAANDASSDGWDENDHPYHKSPNKYAPSIVSSTADGKKLVINTFNSSNITYSMPLETKAGIPGYYKIEAAGFDNISDYTCIKLEDKLLNKTVTLTDAAPYSFQVNAGDDANRFVVHFSKECGTADDAFAGKKGISTDFQNQVNILPSTDGNLITFNLDEATNTTISVTNLLGQTITGSMSVIAQTQSVNVIIPQDFSGMYLVKVESAKGTTIKKFVRK